MKSRISRAALIIVIVMVVSFAIAISVFFATGGLSVTKISTSRVEEEKSFEIEGLKKIDISTVSSEIHIYESDSGKIEAYLSGDISSNLKEKTPELKAELSGSDLNIYIDHPKAITIGIVNFMDLKLDVFIPRDYYGDLEVSSTSGKIEMENLLFEDISIKSVSGKVSFIGLDTESIDIETTSGRILLDDISGKIKASSLSGEVSLGISKLKDDIDIETISGAVTIKLPKESSFGMDLESVSGLISNDFEAKIDYLDNKNIEAIVKDGDFNIDVKTTSGNINIKSE